MSSRPACPLLRWSLRALALAAGMACTNLTVAEAEFEPCLDEPSLQQALERLNEVRREVAAPCITEAATLPPLSLEERLASAAWEQAADLAQRDALSHVDSRQRGLGARLRSVGYPMAGAGENLAAGQTNFDDALAAWLASPKHCANLMTRDYRDVGLACVQRRGTRYERFWVMQLAVPRA
ncbi:MAG TPA: CAP domain-containing protein [Burkholderiaceae bacterium]|nr:CAP domain-containing protein [Burkholderiaceae bacterium]